MNIIKKYTILGERCSGTNYLEELIKINFNITYTSEYGPKHFFGFYDFKKSESEDETLFIGIVRHPIYWLDSFFKEQHHIPNKPKPIHAFLFDEFYSIYDNKTIIENDLNYLTKNKYKNIFEMRFLKNYYLINTMPNNVKNYILINYENLRDNTFSILSSIEDKFCLTRKNTIYQNIKYYKKEEDKLYKKKEIIISLNYQYLSIINLNKIQEAKLGYNISL
jgi:hypothetical protein